MKDKEIELVLLPPEEKSPVSDYEVAIELAKLIYYLTDCN